MDASEKGITSQNVVTIVLILVCTVGIVYWVPNIFLLISQRELTQEQVDITTQKQELHLFLQNLDSLQEQELPLVYTDTPKEAALDLISTIKNTTQFDAYRVWLNPNDIEVQIYYHEFLLKKLYFIQNTPSTKPFVNQIGQIPSHFKFAVIFEPYPNQTLSDELKNIIHSSKTFTFLLDPNSAYALQQAQTIGQAFQDIITDHQQSKDFFPLLPYSTISLSKKRISQNNMNKLLVGYQRNRNDFLYLNTHLSKEERWNRCISNAKQNNFCFLYLHQSEIDQDVLKWLKTSSPKNFAFVLEVLKKEQFLKK